jgi:hypothetical protein
MEGKITIKGPDRGRNTIDSRYLAIYKAIIVFLYVFFFYKNVFPMRANCGFFHKKGLHNYLKHNFI